MKVAPFPLTPGSYLLSIFVVVINFLLVYIAGSGFIKVFRIRPIYSRGD